MLIIGSKRPAFPISLYRSLTLPLPWSYKGCLSPVMHHTRCWTNLISFCWIYAGFEADTPALHREFKKNSVSPSLTWQQWWEAQRSLPPSVNLQYCCRGHYPGFLLGMLQKPCFKYQVGEGGGGGSSNGEQSCHSSQVMAFGRKAG